MVSDVLHYPEYAETKNVLLMLKRDIHQLEYDPDTQYRFHFWAIWFWLLNMPLVLILLVCFPKFWLLIALIYITEINLWALVATHLDAISAALAAKQTPAVPADKIIPTDEPKAFNL